MPKKLLLALLLALCCTGMAWANCGQCGDKHEGGCDKHHAKAGHQMDAMDDNHEMAEMERAHGDAFREGKLVSVYDCRVLDPRCCPGECYNLMDRFHHDECDEDEEELERCDCCPEKCDDKCEKKPCTCAEEEDDDDDDCHCHCYMPYTPPGPRQPLVTVHLWEPLYESNLEPLVDEEEVVEEVITVQGRG